MSHEENKVKEEELHAQEAHLDQAVEQEAEVIGSDADIEWNEDAPVDEQEAKIAQLEAALLASEAKVQDQKDSGI